MGQHVVSSQGTLGQKRQEEVVMNVGHVEYEGFGPLGIRGALGERLGFLGLSIELDGEDVVGCGGIFWWQTYALVYYQNQPESRVMKVMVPVT